MKMRFRVLGLVVLLAFVAIWQFGPGPANALTTGTLTASSSSPGFYPPDGNSGHWATDGTGLPGNCNPNDIHGSNNIGDRASFILDLSSIPNGSTITSVAITPADRANSTAGGKYQTFVRLNSTDTNSGTDITTTTSSGNCVTRSAQTITVSAVKSGTTTLEIGVDRTDTSHSVLVGSLTAVITYTAGSSATLTVHKVYSPTGPSASVPVSVTCTSGTPSPASGTASPATAFTTTVTGFNTGATCTTTETVPAGYTASQATCASVAMVNAGTPSCTITNTLNSATFTVHKVYSPSGPATSVPVSVTCSSGTPAPATGNASPATAFSTTVTGFTVGATCTATETVPAGYTANQAGCAGVAIPVGGMPSCTITNTLNSATLTVNKVYSPSGPATSVPISVTCTSGTWTASGSASPSIPFTTTVTGFTVGATCTTTETVPAGYTANQAGCAGVAIPVGGTPSCTITNTTTATLTVNKVYSPSGPATSVPVSVTCSSGTPTPASGSASPSTPFTTAVTGFSTGATCTTTETVPAGYTASQAGCANVAIVVGVNPSCTITNTLNSAAFTVNKTFSDNSSASVTVGVTCTSGAPAPASGTVSHAAPRTYTITSFNTGATCTATETVPTGYTANQAGCAGVAIPVGGTPSCTITNTLNSATLTVNKVYSPTGPATSVPVSVTCTSGTPTPASGSASPSTPFTTAVTGFTVGATCTTTETVPAGYTANQAGCAGVAIPVGGTPSCTITNTTTATLTVNKVYSPSGPATSVPVSVTCTSGTPTPASGSASPSTPFTTTVTGFNTAGTTCTTTETVPTGYTESDNCTGVSITPGGTPSCTITNTLNSATLTVNKNFSDNSSASVTVGVACTNSGTPSPASGSVSHIAPRTYTITGFTTGATCTATETVPTGYTANQAGCATVAIAVGGTPSCTITNTVTSTTFTVNKLYSPAGPAASVPVSVTCTNGGTPSPASGNASPATAFSTTVTGFAVSGSACTATETVPAGYVATSTCTSVAISNGGAASCTITNTLNSATLTVHKVYSPSGPTTSVPVSVSCSSGTPTPGSGTASPSTSFTTTVTGFNTSGTTCTATETVPGGYTASQVACANVAIAVGGTPSCTITNTLITPDLAVAKTNNVGGNVFTGGTFDWTLTVSDSGATASFSSGQTILTDNLPNTNATYGTPTVATAGGVTGTVSCGSITLSNLSCTASGAVTIPAGATVTVTVPVTAGASAGSLVNPRSGGTTTTGTLSPTGTGFYSAWSVTGAGVPGDCTSNYISSTGGSQRSSFTLDISSIPNGSTITSVAVTAGDRGSATGGVFQTSVRLNGTDTDFGSDLSTSTTSGTCHTESPQTIPVSAVKSGATTLEIGVLRTGSGVTVRVGTLTAVVTYTTASACSVDPNGNVTESNEGNNTCSDTVTVATPHAGPNSVTSSSNCVDDATVGAIAWAAPGNVQTSDTVYATVTLNDNQISHYIKCTGFGFNIPPCSTIAGIVASVKRNDDHVSGGASAANDSSVKLVKAAAIVGNNLATSTAYSATDVVEDHGSASNLWGSTWATSDINASGFGVAFSSFKNGTTGGNVVVAVDQITLTVYYNSTPGCATLTVNKNFSDNSAASVTVAVTCTNSGTPSPASTSVSHASPGTYTITGFTAGATCTATETVPTGYTASSDCTAVAIVSGGTPSCTITNTLNGATLTVNKLYSPTGPSTSVPISVSCSSGTPAPASGSASPATPFTTTVTGFLTGATCTATETVPAGYTASQTDAAFSVSITQGNRQLCTITNTLNSATFTVNKIYSPSGPTTSVPVSVTCTNGGTPSPASGNASPPTPFTTTVTGFSAGATCTATETVPTGYAANQAACASVSITVGGTPSCAITNTLNGATLTVNKNFSDSSLASVTVSVTCTNSGISTPASGTVTHAAPRTYTITGFTAGATCTATEAVPAGYTANQAGCANVSITVGGTPSCTITNTQTSTTFTVNKVYSPSRPAASVPVS